MKKHPTTKQPISSPLALGLLLLAAAFFAACSGDSGTTTPGSIIDKNPSKITLESMTPTSGGSGDHVQIIGKGLFVEKIDKVQFGSQLAVIVDHDSSGHSIVVQAPAQGGGFVNPSPLHVDGTDGKRATLTPGFSYLSNTDCSAAGVTPVIDIVNDVNLLAGDKLRIHGSNFDVAVTVNVEGVPLTLESVIPTDIVALLPANAGKVFCNDQLPCHPDVAVFNDNGCGATDDFLLTSHGLPIEKVFPSLNGQDNFGFDMVTAGNDVNNDGFEDFVVAGSTALSLLSANPDPQLNNYGSNAVWTRQFGTVGSCPQIPVSLIYNLHVANLGNLRTADIYNDFVAIQGFGANKILCLVTGDGQAVDSVVMPIVNNFVGLSAVGIADINADIGRDMLSGRDYYQNATYAQGFVDIYSGKNFFDGNANNNGAIKSFSAPALEGAWGFGENLVNLGDNNNDGSEEIVVAAPAYGGGASSQGALYVYEMQAIWTAVNAVPAVVPSWIRRVTPPAGDKNLGYSLKRIGDVDGDGKADLLAGGFRAAWVYSTASLIQSGGSIAPILRVDGFASFVSVGDAGDVNGDGIPDIMVGDPTFNNESGRVIVFSGDTSAGAAAQPLFAHDGAAGSNDRLGMSLINVGDVNNDGISEIVLGAPKIAPSMVGTHVLMTNMYGNVLYPPF